MTKDLALLVGADQRWLSTTGFLDKVAENLDQGDGGLSGRSQLSSHVTASEAKQSIIAATEQSGPLLRRDACLGDDHQVHRRRLHVRAQAHCCSPL